ncbi:AAA family ATPase [Myroides odoratimimus]|uniref:ATPase AAA-type core domain-containing protein n=1 Tax=Myroides odoratimimus CIP 101113 TaxID=883154 RepID=A0AAV3F8C5_9FLAO|nr:ATP-binding protein [Myroides odoratimimus]EHO15501.1 hypothetical protein HMPREF9715_00072 [Myroides odoratimimus CIP 101113]
MESKERISIRNFAGIEELEMDIKPINILIGPQGVGKSVVVKLIYFFRGLNDEITNIGYFSERDDYDVQSILLHSFNKYFEEEILNNTRFSIEYCNVEGVVFKVEKTETDDLILESSIDLDNLILQLISIKETFELQEKMFENEDDSIAIHYELMAELRKVLRKGVSIELGVDYPQIFVPAGRSFFSTVKSNIFTLVKEDNSFDFFILEFGALFERLKAIKYATVEEVSIDEVLVKVLDGVFVREDNNKEYILHKDNRKVQLQNVSSGQQEALPLMLILKSIILKRLYKGGSTLYIEEPEAHLFPTAQKAIVELLAKTFNSNPDNTQLFITTHSPYILTSFNNLIYAGNIIKDDESKRKAVEKVIAKDTLLDCSKIGAYALTKDGLKDLIDQENHIINAELLDEVSNMIGREFDQLLDIEYAD